MNYDKAVQVCMQLIEWGKLVIMTMLQDDQRLYKITDCGGVFVVQPI